MHARRSLPRQHMHVHTQAHMLPQPHLMSKLQAYSHMRAQVQLSSVPTSDMHTHVSTHAHPHLVFTLQARHCHAQMQPRCGAGFGCRRAPAAAFGDR
eukprot:79165-Chlamydomonas_euryale.AAC.2